LKSEDRSKEEIELRGQDRRCHRRREAFGREEEEEEEEEKKKGRSKTS